MLVKRVYEIDPLACPKCGGQMKVIAFIEPRAPERSDGRGAVIEKILRGHRRAAMVGGLWHPSSPRAPPGDDLVYVPAGDWDGQMAFSDGPWEVYADADTFEATF
jgi:hypothetical protein